MADPWRRKEVIGDATLYLGDCLEILPTLPKVDAVITDDIMGYEKSTGRERSKKRTGGSALGIEAGGDRTPLPSRGTVSGSAGDPIRDSSSSNVQGSETSRHQGEVSRTQGRGERSIYSRNGEHAIPQDGEEEILRGVRSDGESLYSSPQRQPSGQPTQQPASSLFPMPQSKTQKRVVGKAESIITITDPPYGVGIDYASHDDTNIIAFEWLSICRRIGVVCVTPGYVNIFDYPRPDGVLIRFDKTAQSPAKLAWMNKWEPIFVYGKPTKKLAWDVIQTATNSERSWEPKIDHPCPKSITLIRKLVDGLSNNIDTILDPFMGSGTTGVACMNLGRKFTGIEIEEKYFNIARDRIENAQRQQSLLDDYDTVTQSYEQVKLL